MSKSPVAGEGMVCFRNPKDSVARVQSKGRIMREEQPENKSYKVFL